VCKKIGFAANNNKIINMYKFNITISLSAFLLFVSLLAGTTDLYAQKIIESSDLTAGFRFDTDAVLTDPVIHYQQNIHMLSAVDDRPSLQVFGNGRVLVHYPVYMKRAGDYELQLDDIELVNLIQVLSAGGILGFDEKKLKEKIRSYKKKLKAKGQLYEISDAVETVVDIKLDEYQKNSKSKKIKGFHKQFKWKNIEHDAARYKHDSDITKANDSITHLKILMKDVRLVKRQ
jgi:hypothetical protein